MFITTSDIKLWIKQRWINDMERTEKEQIFVLRVTKQDTGLEIGPDKEKQTDTSVFVYVDPYSHELKVLPTIRLAHQFQNMKFVGVLKSFCNEYKINSPQNTISVESRTEKTEKYSMQIDNTSVNDSEICQTAEQMEREITESQSNANQINSHLSLKKDLSSGKEKQQDSKDNKKKKELL